MYGRRRVTGIKPLERLRASLPPTCMTQASKGPAWSEMNATNLPSLEIAASYSDPSQSVSRVNRAPASGFFQK